MNPDLHHDAARGNGRRTSVMLADFIAGHAEPQVSVRHIRDALGHRAYGLLLFVFALPNIVPVGIPGVSTILGLPLVLLSAQLLLGLPAPWFPRWLLDRAISRDRFAAAIGWTLPRLIRLERLLRPRLLWLTGPLAERLLALVCLILAIILALPIPFGNWPPALAIALLALSLIERDGVLYILGMLATLLSATILATFGAAVFLTLSQALTAVLR